MRTKLAVLFCVAALGGAEVARADAVVPAEARMKAAIAAQDAAITRAQLRAEVVAAFSNMAPADVEATTDLLASHVATENTIRPQLFAVPAAVLLLVAR